VTCPVLFERKFEIIFLSFVDMCVLMILSMRLCLGTVSKALFMSMVASTERSGFISLKPSRMCCVRVVSNVVVE